MNDADSFAKVHLAAPETDNVAPRPEVSSTPREGGATGFRQWTRNLFGRRDEHLREEVAPAEGKAYRMWPVETLLAKLGIPAPFNGYLEDDIEISLQVKLQRQGLSLATSITGPLRLRVSDCVPVTDIDQPQVSRYSGLTTALYLLAWLLQADAKPTRKDLSTVDDWIGRYDPKAPWTETAKGTFRWLLSRKLVLTRKRKQRVGKLKRYRNLREKVQNVLLQLVADPDSATPKRMQRLATIYEVLGLDPASIHSDLHRLSTVPSGRKRAAQTTGTLKRTAESTRKAQKLLEKVFGEDEDAENSSPKQEKQIIPIEVEHTNPAEKMWQSLSRKSEWPRADAEELAKSFGMTLGAMLEQVNDLSFERADEAVAEDDGDIIYIDQTIPWQET